ncbi:Uncharacterised protein [Mycobacteroides abscessus subsp. abscessus]|nr:Uncharacterised protein [Mycobacteroides abscessus subsp. abscessus]
MNPYRAVPAPRRGAARSPNIVTIAVEETAIPATKMLLPAMMIGTEPAPRASTASPAAASR